MRIEYVGPHDAVEIPSVGVACRRGETVDVPDEVALNLTKQAGWKSAPSAAVAASDEPKPRRSGK